MISGLKKSVRGAFVALLLLAGSTALSPIEKARSADCTKDTAVWSSRPPTRSEAPYWILYFPYGYRASLIEVRLEKWRGKQKLGTSEGEFWTTNGTVLDGVDIQVNGVDHDSANSDKPLSVALVWLDKDGELSPDWIILARLHQITKWSGGLRMVWEPGHGPESGNGVEAPPDVYRFIGCRNP